MKPRRIFSAARLSLPFTTALVALLATHSGQSQTTRYWDQNGTAAGFGSATGTWTNPTVSRWTTTADGTGTPGASINSLINDPLHFGTDTVALGTGSITVTGTVQAASLRFGSATTGNVTLSGGTINLAAVTSIHVGAGSTTVHNISSVITGAATSLTKTGNTLLLSGANTYTGSTIISAGKLILDNANPLGTTPGVNGTSGISMAAGTSLQADIGLTVAAPITLSGAGNINIAAGTTTAVTANFNGAIGGTTTSLTFTTLDSNSNPAHVINLGGTSTYSGNTTITAGNAANNLTVRNSSGAANALPTTTVLSLTGGSGSGSGRTLTYDLNGQNQTLAGLNNTIVGTTARNHRVTNTGALATLTINGSTNSTYGGVGTSTTFNGNPVNPTALINGAIALAKDGSGTFTLTGANTYTGTTTLNQGTLTIGTGGTLGATTGALTVNNTNTGVGTAAVLNLASAVDTTKGSLSGTITLASSGTNTATINTQTGRTFTVNQTAAGTYEGAIAGAGSFTLGSLSTNTLTLAGRSTFTGNVTVSAGTLAAGINASGVNTALGNASTVGRTITVASGANLNFNVANVLSTNFSSSALPSLLITGTATNNIAGNNALGNVTLTGGTLTATAGHANYGAFNINGTVTSTGNSTISAAGGARMMLTSSGANNVETASTFDVQSGTLTVSADLSEVTTESKISGLTKIGAGTMILSGTNTYTGATNINAGTLVVNGSIGSSATNVGGGATLTGSGTVGNTTVAVAGNVSNNNGVAGASLTIGSLTFSGSANVDTFSNSTTAPIIVTNSLASGSLGTVTINPTAASWTNGLTYDLISYGSVGGAGLGQFALGPVVAGLTARQIATFGNSASAITLAISGDNPKWTGLDNGNWQTGTTGASENWKLVTAGTATAFLTTDDVLFDDSAAGTTTVDINAANVSPLATTFSNSSLNYTLGSTGGFGIASGALTKNGSGSLTINNANTYAGGTTLNAGTLVLGNASAIGSGTLTITGGNLDSSVANLVNAGNNAQAWNGDFAFTGTENLNLGTGAVTMGANRTVTVTANTLTAGGVIGGGAVSLTKAGTGTLILTGNNTYSGGTTINDNSGTLQATKNAAVTNAIGTGAVAVGAGSTLVLDITKTTNTTDAIANTFTGAGLLKLQFAAGTTARNLTIPNVTGFSGTIQLSNLGTTGDKWNAASLGTVAGSLVVDSGSTIFVQTAPAAFTGGITLNGAGNSEGRGALRMGATSLGGNITLAGSSTIGMESAASALITGNITSGAAGTQTLTLGGTGSSGGTLTGIIGGGTGTIDLSTAVGGTYTLTNTNTYTGTTTIAVGTALRLGDGTTGNDGTINATSGVTNNGTLTFNRFGSDTWANAIAGTGAVTKLGAGTQTLSGLSAIAASNYSGTTTINEGTLAFTTTSPSLTGGLTFGSANTITTAGILDLTNASATFGGALAVNTNSATANEIKIGAAQILTINNNVQIGATTPVTGLATITKLNLTGGGTFNVATASAGTFLVGASTLTSTTTSQDSTLDLTALLATTINTSTTGTIRVNAATSSNVAGYKSTLLLPAPVVADTVATATLTAGTIGVGTGSGFNSGIGQVNTLQLGTGLTTLNADNINVGTGGRDIGQIIFGQAGGDLKIRAADGISRATALNVGFGGGNTGTGNTTANLVDFSTHDVDILVTSLNVGSQPRTNNLTSEFKFGAGDASLASTLDATNVNIGFRTGGASNAATLTNRVNLSGGAVTFGNVGGTGTGANIGGNTYTGAGAASTIGELNISGGTVTIHNGNAGFAVQLGSNVAAGGGTVTASLNLTGGTTTLGGDIVRGATGDRTTSTLSLNGASAILDMGGHDITNLTGITYTDGTLKNLGTVNTGMTLAGTGTRVFDQETGISGEIQGAVTGTGVGLDKQGVGKLTLSGTNNYTSATLVSAGTLFVTGSITSNVTVSDNATLGGGGTVQDISFAGGSFFDITLALAGNPLDSAAGTISFATTGFGVDNLRINGGTDWSSVGNDTYTLFTGILDETNLDNFGSMNPFDIGGGRSAYFLEGSLQLVVIPEPSAALLGCLSALLLLRRRRS